MTIKENKATPDPLAFRVERRPIELADSLATDYALLHAARGICTQREEVAQNARAKEAWFAAEHAIFHALNVAAVYDDDAQASTAIALHHVEQDALHG